MTKIRTLEHIQADFGEQTQSAPLNYPWNRKDFVQYARMRQGTANRLVGGRRETITDGYRHVLDSIYDADRPYVRRARRLAATSLLLANGFDFSHMLEIGSGLGEFSKLILDPLVIDHGQTVEVVYSDLFDEPLRENLPNLGRRDVRVLKLDLKTLEPMDLPSGTNCVVALNVFDQFANPAGLFKRLGRALPEGGKIAVMMDLSPSEDIIFERYGEKYLVIDYDSTENFYTHRYFALDKKMGMEFAAFLPSRLRNMWEAYMELKPMERNTMINLQDLVPLWAYVSKYLSDYIHSHYDFQPPVIDRIEDYAANIRRSLQASGFRLIGGEGHKYINEMIADPAEVRNIRGEVVDTQKQNHVYDYAFSRMRMGIDPSLEGNVLEMCGMSFIAAVKQ
jgi:SAM-dependent methyltransferase